jgi:hypothetical protein
MNKILSAMNSRVSRTIAAVGAGLAILAVAGIAGATGSGATTALTSGFATEGTNLTTYFGLALILVLAAVGFGVGIRFLVKWVKFAFQRGS